MLKSFKLKTTTFSCFEALLLFMVTLLTTSRFTPHKDFTALTADLSVNNCSSQCRSFRSICNNKEQQVVHLIIGKTVKHRFNSFNCGKRIPRLNYVCHGRPWQQLAAAGASLSALDLVETLICGQRSHKIQHRRVAANCGINRMFLCLFPSSS